MSATGLAPGNHWITLTFNIVCRNYVGQQCARFDYFRSFLSRYKSLQERLAGAIDQTRLTLLISIDFY